MPSSHSPHDAGTGLNAVGTGAEKQPPKSPADAVGVPVRRSMDKRGNLRSSLCRGGRAGGEGTQKNIGGLSVQTK